jgi:hypothetical protein
MIPYVSAAAGDGPLVYHSYCAARPKQLQLLQHDPSDGDESGEEQAGKAQNISKSDIDSRQISALSCVFRFADSFSLRLISA